MGTFTTESSGVDGTTQEINFAGTAFTPKVLWIFGTLNGSANAHAEHMHISYGFSDGTNDACVVQASVDNGTTSVTGGRVYTNAITANLDAGGDPANENRRASLETFDSDGFTLRWDNSDGNALLLHYLAVGGTDITNVKVTSHNALSGAGTGNEAYTGVGFQGDFLNLIIGGVTGTANTNNAVYNMMIGAATSSSARWVFGSSSEDNVGTSDTYNFKEINRVFASYSNTTGSLDALADFVSFDSDGFTINYSDAPNNATNQVFASLVIKGGLWDVGNGTAPAATGAQNLSLGAGRDPEAFLIFTWGDTTTSSGAAAEAESRMSIGGSDNSLRERCGSMHDTDAAANMINTRISRNDKVIQAYTANATAGSSTTLAEADCTDMSTTDQITLNWTTTLNGMGYVWFAVSSAVAATEDPGYGADVFQMIPQIIEL